MPEDVKNHFIKNIEIKNFKCFDNFKAEGFGRVNLIGGKNNVGKTAFMEACFIADTLKTFVRFLSLEKYKNNTKIQISEKNIIVNTSEYIAFQFIKVLLKIIQERHKKDFLQSWILDTYNLNSFDNFEINIENEKIISKNNHISIDLSNKIQIKFDLSSHRDNPFYYQLKENPKSFPDLGMFKFVTSSSNSQSHIRKLLGKIKQQNKNHIVDNYIIDNYLKDIFQVDRIDLDANGVIIFKDGKPYDFSEFGDGIKSFINIILTLHLKENSIIYIDEIENGIHYTNLDKLWEIILTISKDQNVQVFATTHSKECIESYARVAKRLEDEDTKFIELFRDNDEIKTIVLDNEMLTYQLEQNHEVR